MKVSSKRLILLSVFLFALFLSSFAQKSLFAVDVTASDIKDPAVGLSPNSLRFFIETVGGLCDGTYAGQDDNIKIDWAKFRSDYSVLSGVDFPIHYKISRPLQIPATCKASSITIDGQQSANGTFGETEAVIDGTALTGDNDCAFIISSPTTKVTLKNITFVNTSKKAAVCVTTNVQVVLDKVNLGIRRINATGAPVANGNSIGVDTTGKNLTIQNNSDIEKNAIGVSIESTGQAIITGPNTISNNTQVGVLVSGNSSKITGNILKQNGINYSKGGAAISLIATASNNLISSNIISGNETGGVTLLGSGSANTISQNSTFSNIGLGIDLIQSPFILGPTLFSDKATTANDSIHLAEDVIIKNLKNGSFEFTANPHVAAAKSFKVEVFTADSVVSPADSAIQVRDGRSYGEGQAFVTSVSPVSATPNKRLTLTFAGTVGKPYTVTLTDEVGNTSEFSAVVTAPPPGDNNGGDIMCEGEGGDETGKGILAPKSPSDVKVVRSGSGAVVTFNDNSGVPTATNPEEDGFRIERAVGKCNAASLTFIVAGTLPKQTGISPPIRTFNDPGPVPAGDVCYQVVAFRKIPNSNGHDLQTCDAAARNADSTGGGSNNPLPPVIKVNPNPVPATDPVVVILTSQDPKVSTFCVQRADTSCQLATDADFKPVGTVTLPTPPGAGVGNQVPFNDPNTLPGHVYCYRAENQIDGKCDTAQSNRDEADKNNSDGRPAETPTPSNLIAEGSGGCSISNTASHFNFLSLIALLAIAPVALTRAFRFRKV